jgi:hypothetical protein
MSYSFNVTGKTKAQAKAAALQQVGLFVANQEAHERDALLVANTIAGVVDTLDEPGEGQQIAIQCYGSTGGEWNSMGGMTRVTSNSVTVQAACVAIKEA